MFFPNVSFFFPVYRILPVNYPSLVIGNFIGYFLIVAFFLEFLYPTYYFSLIILNYEFYVKIPGFFSVLEHGLCQSFAKTVQRIAERNAIALLHYGNTQGGFCFTSICQRRFQPSGVRLNVEMILNINLLQKFKI